MSAITFVRYGGNIYWGTVRRSRKDDALLIIHHQFKTQSRDQRGRQSRDSRTGPHSCKFTASLPGAAEGLALVMSYARHVLVELSSKGILAH
jgi:hypothetical protein